jgi:hypothetical protein
MGTRSRTLRVQFLKLCLEVKCLEISHFASLLEEIHRRSELTLAVCLSVIFKKVVPLHAIEALWVRGTRRA